MDFLFGLLGHLASRMSTMVQAEVVSKCFNFSKKKIPQFFFFIPQ